MPNPLQMHGSQKDGEVTDPVCGMSVNPEDARQRGLHLTHEDKEYFFCGKGCKLDFRDDPAKYLAFGYRPQM